MIFQKAMVGLIFAMLSIAIFAREVRLYPEIRNEGISSQKMLAAVGVADKKQRPKFQNTPPAKYDDPNFTLNSFRSTDEETELLLQEIFNLSSDIAIVSEQDNVSQRNQVVVIVTLNAPKLFDLSYIELKINSQTVAAYRYTENDVIAMQLGGGHRLYITQLPNGIHKMSVYMLGRVPRDPDYKRDITYRFIAGIARTVLEINIDSKDSTTYPVLNVTEWN